VLKRRRGRTVGGQPTACRSVRDTVAGARESGVKPEYAIVQLCVSTKRFTRSVYSAQVFKTGSGVVKRAARIVQQKRAAAAGRKGMLRESYGARSKPRREECVVMRAKVSSVVSGNENSASALAQRTTLGKREVCSGARR